MPLISPVVADTLKPPGRPLAQYDSTALSSESAAPICIETTVPSGSVREPGFVTTSVCVSVTVQVNVCPAVSRPSFAVTVTLYTPAFVSASE